ncbi:MAG: tetratricopeptide repeat protein [Bacteroidota bacterium]|nr:tetratricopeptide repeat protein [Bacteroidota bacterium]
MAAWCSSVFVQPAGRGRPWWPKWRQWLLLLPGGLLLALPLAAQVPAPVPDSLLRALQTATTDTARAKTALRLSAALAATDTARARRYARQALALSQATGFGYGQAHSWLQLSALAIIRNDNARAARYGARAQAAAAPLYRQRPAPRLARLLAAIANNRGTVADRQGQYAVAVRNYLRAATYLAPLPEAGCTLLTVYANLGNSLLTANQPAQAARYWRLAAALAPQTGPVPELLPVYLQLARLHLQQAHPDSAERVLRTARPLLAAGQLYADEYYGTLGQYYRSTRQPTAARRAFGQAVAYAQRKGAAGYEAKLLFELGQLARQAGDLPAARASLERSLALTEQLGDSRQLIDNLEGLARLAEQGGQWAEALRYYRRSHELRDSLAGTAVRAQVAQLETRYRTRQQAGQLRALRQTQATEQLVLRQQRRLNAVYLVLLLALVAAGGLATALLRYRQRQAARQREQEKALLTAQAVLQGQEEERRRLARDLHDGLGGMLSTVKYYLAAARSRAALPEEASTLVSQSIEHLDSSIGELRRVARNLMPEALLAFGLAQALQDLCATTQQAGNLHVQLHLHGLETRLPQTLEVELYRLVQELLNNVLKHAQAQEVLVQLMRHGPELHLVVEDDGRGFDPSVVGTGVGLRSVQARARYLGGTLEVQSAPGQGTSFSLELRLPA